MCLTELFLEVFVGMSTYHNSNIRGIAVGAWYCDLRVLSDGSSAPKLVLTSLCRIRI